MQKLLKWAGIGLVVVLALATGVYALAWRASEQALARRFTVNDPPLAMARDAAALERGHHLFITRGCQDCHGAGGIGHTVFDAGPVMLLVAPNITPHGLGTRYDPDRIAAAIRHGVRADGTGLVFMPTGDFADLGDADTAALVAYVQSLPASDHDPGHLQIRPLARVLYLFGKFPLVPAEHIDHSPRTRSPPPAAATAAYGEYLAHACTGCHGADLAGQRIPGTPPSIPPAANLTPGPGGLKDWSEADFDRLLRTGKKPDGRGVDPIMPWPAFAQMSDDERHALWLYLRTLPARPGANR
ncbi:MAG TPA: cytochrome c [Xanthomonadaceae bacterium]|jgi:mono/diheme cytochrome c family protein